MVYQETLTIDTDGRGSDNISQKIGRIVEKAGVSSGLCHLFMKHTSASLMLCENADPSVRQDLETILRRLAPDGDPAYRHTLEGPDDMSAHIRSILTNMDLTLPIVDGRLGLGTWQGIFLYEHRSHGHRRSIVVTVMG
jgi:secondary thiamine-phosphate synthase enzyme